MPFKSKKQSAKCYALKSKGKNKNWDCDKWAKKTDYKKIPKNKNTKEDKDVLEFETVLKELDLTLGDVEKYITSEELDFLIQNDEF